MSSTDDNTTPQTTGQFTSALVIGLLAVAAFTGGWRLFYKRKRFRRVFQPRVELAVLGKQPHPLPDGVFSWWKTILETPDEMIIVTNGLDAYFFVRFIKVFGLYLLGPYAILTCAVLVPVAVTSHRGVEGVDLLTFGNISPDQFIRHTPYYIIAIVLIFWTLYLISTEFVHLDEERQKWLTSTSRASLARTRTVMVMNLSPQYLSEEAIAQLVTKLTTSHSNNGASAAGASADTAGVGGAAGGAVSTVQAIWFSRTNMKQIEQVYDQRNAECELLEGAEASLLALAAKNERKGKSPRVKGRVVAYEPEEGLEGGGRTASDDFIDEYVKPKDRPKWRGGFWGLFGEKRTLRSALRHIKEKNEKLERLRVEAMLQKADGAGEGKESGGEGDKGKGGQVKIGNTAWIRFSSQHEAHLFARLIRAEGRGLGMRLVDSRIEVVPEDIVWNNTSINAYDRKMRNIVSWLLTIVLVVFWPIPFFLAGFISNIDALCSTVGWLSWLISLDDVAVIGILKAVIPLVLVHVWPFIFDFTIRGLVKLQGVPQYSEIQLRLFQRYWVFLLFNALLVCSLASGLVPALANVGETAKQLPTSLAVNLPAGSILFLTFLAGSIWTAAAGGYSRVVPTLQYWFLRPILRGFSRPILRGKIPRKYWLSETQMDTFEWSTIWPAISLFVCWCVAYSTVQPLIIVVGMVGFALLYVACKYLLIWCADQPDSGETGGLFYLKALKTVFITLYVEEFFLAVLFSLSYSQRTQTDKTDLAGCILMAVAFFITIAAQYWLSRRFPRNRILYTRSSYLQSQTPSTTNPVSKPLTDQAEIAVVPTTSTLAHIVNQENEFAGAHYGNTSELHERAFDHPALWKKPPIIWIADDELGIGRLEVERIKSEGVDASCEFAKLDKKGKLSVERGPPDGTWYGGVTTSERT
ncbi:uncharacterized protein EI90DRAFT_3120088 [Cantharellus anzutake]|uniref:uncharacterized protein n=1 Tax=Cantharellus anzutake TaxID=1750568 RepID=UPI001907C5D4|nr:uncharacterized protein EI90DRAFT_3120088 [Cantharellus anzutake]KAF8335823.1 hypothetical protein EI90DRAFT_3120088 [Cantharellus anzutake]